MQPEAQKSLELTCALVTGLTQNEVRSIALTGPKRYKVYQIPKRSGGMRTICHPSRELKALQYVFLRKILRNIPVHDTATAYKIGSSIKDNVTAHLTSRVILKLDFENFFPSITTLDWAAYVHNTMPNWTEGDIRFSQLVMFWGAGGYQPQCLSIGAPTSPLISNALMFEFDNIMSSYANINGLIYTRYADDITLSTMGHLDKDAVILQVNATLHNMNYPSLKLNNAKTRLASNATSRRVTGLIISNNGTVSLGRDRKRLISAMVHHAICGKSTPENIASLAGLLSFATDVEPRFVDFLRKKYGFETLEALQLRKR